MIIKRIVYNELTKLAEVTLTNNYSFFIANSIKELASQYNLTIEIK